MKKKIFVFIIFLLNILINTSGQNNNLDSIINEINPFFKEMICKSLQKVNKMNKKYCDDKFPPVYIADIKMLSLEKKECEYTIYYYYDKADYDNLDVLGYITCGNCTVLIYSEKYKSVLQETVKIPKMNEEVKNEIVFKTSQGGCNIQTYIVKYKRNKFKIKRIIS
jgi:hypothetical protein